MSLEKGFMVWASMANGNWPALCFGKSFVGRHTWNEANPGQGDDHELLSFPRNLLASEELPDLIRRLERDYLLHHLRRLDGDPRKLCDFLGLSRRQLYRRCARLGVRLMEERRRLP